MSDLTGQWSYSTDEENYHGECDTREEAIAELFAENPDCTSGWIGTCVAVNPESFVCADDIIEQITRSDEFSIDAAQDWPEATREQMHDLTDRMRATFCAWMDAHDLRPTFYTIDNTERVTRPEPMHHDG